MIMCTEAKQETLSQPLVHLSDSRERFIPRAVWILELREHTGLRVKVRHQPGHQIARDRRETAVGAWQAREVGARSPRSQA